MIFACATITSGSSKRFKGVIAASYRRLFELGNSHGWVSQDGSGEVLPHFDVMTLMPCYADKKQWSAIRPPFSIYKWRFPEMGYPQFSSILNIYKPSSYGGTPIFMESPKFSRNLTDKSPWIPLRRPGTWRAAPRVGPTAGATTSPPSAAASHPPRSRQRQAGTPKKHVEMSPSKMGGPWKYAGYIIGLFKHVWTFWKYIYINIATYMTWNTGFPLNVDACGSACLTSRWSILWCPVWSAFSYGGFHKSGYYKWMVYHENSYQNGWFGGIPKF